MGLPLGAPARDCRRSGAASSAHGGASGDDEEGASVPSRRRRRSPSPAFGQRGAPTRHTKEALSLILLAHSIERRSRRLLGAADSGSASRCSPRRPPALRRCPGVWGLVYFMPIRFAIYFICRLIISRLLRRADTGASRFAATISRHQSLPAHRDLLGCLLADMALSMPVRGCQNYRGQMPSFLPCAIALAAFRRCPVARDEVEHASLRLRLRWRGEHDLRRYDDGSAASPRPLPVPWRGQLDMPRHMSMAPGRAPPWPGSDADYKRSSYHFAIAVSLLMPHSHSRSRRSSSLCALDASRPRKSMSFTRPPFAS